MGVGILGIGSAWPDKVLTNHDLEKMVETSDEWIRTRSGIAERRVLPEGGATSDLASVACKRAIEHAGLTPADIDLIICATFSPDTLIPSTACHLMEQLDIPDCPAFDVNAACTGWLYGLASAQGMITHGLASRALVVGADAISKFTNWQDRSTCVLFGDGAGAVVLGEVDGDRGIQSAYLGADGRMGKHICIPGGGSRKPPSQEVIDNSEQFIQMDGNEVFKFAVRIMHRALDEAVRRAGIQVTDLDWVIPHQANVRIIDGAVKRLKLPAERFVMNIERFGNTSAASVPLAMDEAVRDGRIQRGDLLGFVAFGGGLTWGSMIVRF